MARATILDLTYESTKKHIKAIYDQCATTSETNVDNISDIEIETENSHHEQGCQGGKYNHY